MLSLDRQAQEIRHGKYLVALITSVFDRILHMTKFTSSIALLSLTKPFEVNHLEPLLQVAPLQ